MKANLLYALALAAVLAVGTLQASQAPELGGLTLARNTPEPPAHPDFDSPDPFDRKLAA